MSDIDKSELRKKIGDIKIARNNRTELFYTLAGHNEFENIMQIIEEYTTQQCKDARLGEVNALLNHDLHTPFDGPCPNDCVEKEAKARKVQLEAQAKQTEGE